MLLLQKSTSSRSSRQNSCEVWRANPTASHQRPKALRSICPAVAPWDLHPQGVLSDPPASLISSLQEVALQTAVHLSPVMWGPAQVTLPKHTLLNLWDKGLKLPTVKEAACFCNGSVIDQSLQTYPIFSSSESCVIKT